MTLPQSGSLERAASNTWQVASRLNVVCFSYLLFIELSHEGDLIQKSKQQLKRVSETFSFSDSVKMEPG
jgi:hypothetical protein